MGFYTQDDPVVVDAVTAVFDQGKKLESQRERQAFIFSVAVCAIELINKNLGEEVTRKFLGNCQSVFLQNKAEIVTTH